MQNEFDFSIYSPRIDVAVGLFATNTSIRLVKLKIDNSNKLKDIYLQNCNFFKIRDIQNIKNYS